MRVSYVLDIGLYNDVVADQLAALRARDFAPGRLIQNLRNSGQVIESISKERKAKFVIFMLANQIVSSAISQEELAKRLRAVIDEQE